MELLSLPIVKSLMITLLTVIFSAYTIYWQKKMPDLPSWSKSYYELKVRPIFQFWTLSISILVILIGLNYWWLTFGCMLTLVAFFPTIRNKKHFKWHMLGAVFSLVGAYVYILYVSDFAWVYIVSSLLLMVGWLLIIKRGEPLQLIKITLIKTIESIVFIEVILYFILELL